MWRACAPGLGSELANHVAAYGVWLHGQGWWRECVFAAPGEVIRKQAALKFQLAELRRVWLDMLRAEGLPGDWGCGRRSGSFASDL